MSGFDPNLISSTSAMSGSSAMQDTSAIANLTGSQNPHQVNFHDNFTQVTQSPGGNYFPSDTPQENIGAMDQQVKIAGAEAMSKQQNPNMLGALMLSSRLMNQGQQRQPQQAPQGQVSGGKQINVSDPIGALLASKLKKKQPISLL
jgi:hypothetical protein